MYLIYKNYAAAILKFKINTIKLNTIGVDTSINIVSEYDFYETPLKKMMVNNSIHYTQYKMNLYIYDEFNNICVYLCGAFIKNVDFEKADILEFTYNLNVDYYSILDDISKISDLKNILRLMKLKKFLNESV